MKGLIIKDFINLRKYARTVLIVIAFYVLFSVMMDDSAFMSGMIVLLFSMTVITSFAYDKQAKWEQYALSLPLPRRTMVKSKYVLSLLLALLGMVLSLVLSLMLNLFTKKAGVVEQLTTSYVLFLISILFLSIILPLIFKFGVEKARIFMIIVIAIPTAAIFALDKVGATLPAAAQLDRILLYSPLMLAALYIFSYMLSRYIFEKKEL